MEFLPGWYRKNNKKIKMKYTFCHVGNVVSLATMQLHHTAHSQQYQRTPSSKENMQKISKDSFTITTLPING